MEPKDRLIVALDISSMDHAIDLVYELKDEVGMFKVGSQLFTACGPLIVERIVSAGLKVFLDLKYHDCPHTVGKAVAEAAKLGPEFITVHCSGHKRGMLEAVANKGKSKIAAVTVLTCLNNDECGDVYHNSPANQVFKFADMAKKCGADAVVCAATAEEAGFINKDKRFEGLIKICPGIRDIHEDRGYQQRVATASQATLIGADYIVVGGPIIEARLRGTTPVAAARSIVSQINFGNLDA